MNWSSHSAALFDLDGVITPTADVHMSAWSQMFNDFLAGRGVTERYTEADYFAHVDGRPRYDGVRAVLTSRGIDLPEGDPSDSPDEPTVCGLGNRKNALFTQILARDGVAAYPGSVRLIEHLLGLGLPIAVVSSSKNASDVLAAAGLRQHFPVVVDGVVAARDGLPGKPAPDTFLHAARELGADPTTAVVLEDAVSGVQAGRAGGFGLVVGVDRGAGPDTLVEAGADLVVTDLAELLPGQGAA